MKAIQFSNRLKEAGLGLAAVGATEPIVVVRNGPTGVEIPIAKVKFRKDNFGPPRIVLEI